MAGMQWASGSSMTDGKLRMAYSRSDIMLLNSPCDGFKVPTLPDNV